jgi:hypothetical protein
MYYYTYSNENLAWFEAKGRSLYEILNLVEDNTLSLNNIEIIGKSLYVSLYNDSYKFIEGTPYYLLFENLNKYCKINRAYDEFTKIPDHQRKEIKDVSDMIWYKLFNCKYRLYDCPSNEEEYKDEYFEYLENEDSSTEEEIESDVEFSDIEDDIDTQSEFYESDYYEY